MKTIGIMSMQRIYNYGSSLQGYALRKLIGEIDSSAKVFYLDYRPGTPLINSNEHQSRTKGRLHRTFEKLFEYGMTRSSLTDKIRFFNHKRHYEKKYFPLVGINTGVSDTTEVDVQVIGSDEVFNCVQDNVNVGYSRDLFGHNSSAKRLISYAGSFGNTTIEKIETHKIRDELAHDFLKFHAVSVRDLNSQEIVQELTGTKPDIHLDPTLVYGLMQDPCIPSSRQRQEKYIIVYGYSGRFTDTENHHIRQYASSIGAKILAFGGLQAGADEFVDCDPFTLLAYFRDAEAVVTDTFHGSIFAIINEVPFATVIRKSHGTGYGNSEKLGYLLNVLGLEIRALNRPEMLANLMQTAIDFGPVRAVRDEQRARTLGYLRSAISS